jgi:hypothetical protein
MGSDKYVKCPFCKIDADNKLAEKYGKIPMSEFNSLKHDLEKLTNQENVGVNYEIDLDENGVFTIDFGAQCSKCLMKWTEQFTAKGFKLPATRGTKK